MNHRTTIAALLMLLLCGAAHAATWDTYGCKPNDPNFDNGPPLSKMLARQMKREITTATTGNLGDYYVKTSIEWPQGTGGDLEGAGGYTFAYSIPTIGATRIVWSGPAGGNVVNYHASGGRIAKLIIAGGPLTNDYKIVAGGGLVVHAHSEPPSGNLVTDQLSVTQCDIGLRYLATPNNDHADLAKHFALLVHRCNTAYQVEGDQSCPHFFYAFDCREGYKTVFNFQKGGALHVFGMYLGGCQGGTLLSVGRANDYVGDYEIQGLQVDGGCHGLKLLEYGRYLFRCRISGNVGKAEQLATPFVVAREEVEISDIRIRCKNAKFTEKKP